MSLDKGKIDLGTYYGAWLGWAGPPAAIGRNNNSARYLEGSDYIMIFCHSLASTSKCFLCIIIIFV